jgi:ATP-dependent RNA helicase RhlE
LNLRNAFADLGINETLCRALDKKNFVQPTPIQTKAIPVVLSGRDVLGIAQTGTGKTAAFALPLLQHLGSPAKQGPRALVLAPTRELAIQIDNDIASFSDNSGLRHAVIFGGVSQFGQEKTLRRGADVIVATPGRLLDLMDQGIVRLQNVSCLVLDEADRMLDMGFIRDIRRILAKVPSKRQTLLFSATMQGEVAKLAADILNEPVRIDIAPEAPTVERIEQKVYHVTDGASKPGLLTRLLQDPAMSRVILFTRTKHRANAVTATLEKKGIAAEAIHGNKSQGARQRALENFRSGRARVLVATDIAARGIDVAGITHVVNYDIPVEPESYVHRIGRTARNLAEGIALSFCDGSEYGSLRDIERLIRRTIDVAEGTPPARVVKAAQPKRGGNGNRQGQGHGYGHSAQGKGPGNGGGANRGRQPKRGRRFGGQRSSRAA